MAHRVGKGNLRFGYFIGSVKRKKYPEIGSGTNVLSCNHTFLVAVEGYQQLLFFDNLKSY